MLVIYNTNTSRHTLINLHKSTYTDKNMQTYIHTSMYVCVYIYRYVNVMPRVLYQVSNH